MRSGPRLADEGRKVPRLPNSLGATVLAKAQFPAFAFDSTPDHRVPYEA
jgi:hypothetical protein